jgi:hypothetical protein
VSAGRSSERTFGPLGVRFIALADLTQEIVTAG